MTGQNDRQDESLTGQVCDQAGHCRLTGRYFQPCWTLLQHALFFLVETLDTTAVIPFLCLIYMIDITIVHYFLCWIDTTDTTLTRSFL